jgi:hypothetical protein
MTAKKSKWITKVIEAIEHLQHLLISLFILVHLTIVLAEILRHAIG